MRHRPRAAGPARLPQDRCPHLPTDMTAAHGARSCNRRGALSKDVRVRAIRSGGEFRRGGDSGTASRQDVRGVGMLRDRRSPCVARAQETINYASVSGRVTDPQGACRSRRRGQRQAGQHQCRCRDGDGLRRTVPLPVSEDRTVRGQGPRRRISDVIRTLTLTIGSAYNLPIALSVQGVDASVTVTGEAAVLETHAARSPGPCLRPRFRACR